MSHHVDYRHTEEANDRRFAKACDIAGALRAADYTWHAARRLSQEQRRVVERFAQVPPRCSPETWTLALDLLKKTAGPKVGAA